jgi:hypothetical protein
MQLLWWTTWFHQTLHLHTDTASSCIPYASVCSFSFSCTWLCLSLLMHGFQVASSQSLWSWVISLLPQMVALLMSSHVTCRSPLKLWRFWAYYLTTMAPFNCLYSMCVIVSSDVLWDLHGTSFALSSFWPFIRLCKCIQPFWIFLGQILCLLLSSWHAFNWLLIYLTASRLVPILDAPSVPLYTPVDHYLSRQYLTVSSQLCSCFCP